MPKVIVTRPNITTEQEKEALKLFSSALSSLLEDEYGVEFEIETQREKE